MAKIKIDGKEHHCSEAIMHEIMFLRSKVQAANQISSKIEEIKDEESASNYERNEKMQKLLNELKQL